MKNLLLATFLAAAQHAAAAPVACLIEPEKVAEVGTSAIGIIDRIPVERGNVVRQGQVVAYLKADVERASVNVASARAQAEAELKAAIAAQDLAQAKLERMRDLFGVGFVSREAVEQADAEARISKNRVVQAKEGQKVAHYELALTNSQLEQRSIRSPFSGIVVDRYRTEGERVEREPIVRIAKLHPLRVEAILSAAYFGQIKAGTSAAIKTDIPGMEDLSAKVVLVDAIIDAASNTFRVRLELPNPDHRIPAGLRCKADFDGLPEISGRHAAHQDKAAIRRASVSRVPITADGIVLKTSAFLAIGKDAAAASR